MKNQYDALYKTKNLFGSIYKELLEFFSQSPPAKLLDVGCGQGRNAIPLAKLGYEVTGIDVSHVGIKQMKKDAKAHGVDITGVVADMYAWDAFLGYQYVLLDNMFHFLKRDRAQETSFIKNMLVKSSKDVLIVFCIQDKGKRIAILKELINAAKNYEKVCDKKFVHAYNFFENSTEHSVQVRYRMIVIKNSGLHVPSFLHR